MKAYFGRRYMLSASHRLHTDALSAGANLAAYGKCNNPHGHGHNYVIEVVAGGDVDAEVKREVLDRFDHANLNLDPLFASQVPTTENLCRAVFGVLKRALPTGDLEYVRVEETENNFFQYYGR